MQPALAHSTPWQSRSGIPIRNIWLLMFYASELFRYTGEYKVGTEKQPDELPDLVAEVLCHAVDHRLLQNLSQGYVSEESIRSRVRGQVDMLRTERLGLFQRGKVACRYQDLTMNTPRNRYVRGALFHLAGLAGTKDLRRRCRMFASRLQQCGVTGSVPTRSMVCNERFGRHDLQDRPMVAAAKLAFDLRIPTEQGKNETLLSPSREETWLRYLFEKAVAGFYEVTLGPKSWRVKPGVIQRWPVSEASPGTEQILPGMVTDIVLENINTSRRIIIDTKFARILTLNAYQQKKLDSKYLYQMYAYLRTQEDADDPASLNAEGLLLHPAIGSMVDEEVIIQGHRIRFATVDLAAETSDIRKQLFEVVFG